MRKKINVYFLIASMMVGSIFSPVERVEASSYGKMETRTVGSTVLEDENNQSEVSITEDTTRADGTTEVATTETTAEIPTTEEELEKHDFIESDLNPATAKVLVIDPGHCNKHPGAAGNGLREEVVVMDIARYSEDILNTYGDITVYMTREDGGCCEALNLGDCLIGRNNYAKLLDANFLVSMHINAGSSSGANLLVAYKSGYHSEVAKETQKFGKLALAELKKIGISNRGFLLRKSRDSRYENGKAADYYSIVRNGVVQNIPSVIIEHGYITSSSDSNRFFRTKGKRKMVAKADAKAIINYYNLNQKIIKGKFKEENHETFYVTPEGKKVTGWIKEDGKWYYFDEETAKLVKGFLEKDGNRFYLNPSNGQMQVGWFEVDGNVYLAKGNGTLVNNEVYTDGRYLYLFNQDGKQMRKGFRSVNGKTYYLNRKRQVVKGLKKIGGKHYFFDSKTGERKTGWVSYKNNKYYFNKKSGKMETGWEKIKGTYYYFSKKTGKMQKNRWIGKYYVNKKGKRTKTK